MSEKLIILDKNGREFERPRIGFCVQNSERDVKPLAPPEDAPHVGGNGIVVPPYGHSYWEIPW